MRKLVSKIYVSKGKCGAVSRILDYSSEVRWFEPTLCFWRCRCRIRRIRSGVNSRQLCRTQRQAARRAAWPGTARHGTAQYGTQPPRLYFLADVTRRAYFYGLYYFAFLECALLGVNPRPQFGQCSSFEDMEMCLSEWLCERMTIDRMNVFIVKGRKKHTKRVAEGYQTKPLQFLVV